MPRLPDLDALGQRPIPVGRRTVASVRNAGAVGEAISGIGNQAMQAARQLEEELSRRGELERQTATAAFLESKIRLDSEFAQDQDYDTKEARYSEALTKAREAAAKGISAPRARALFDTNANLDIARGVAAVKSDAFAGKGDVARAAAAESIHRMRETLLLAKDPKDVVAAQSVIGQQLASLRSQGYITAAAEQEQRHKIVQDFAEGWLDIRPEQEQIDLLSQSQKAEKSGNLTDFIPPDRRADLLRQAQSRLRTEQRAERAEQRLAMQAQVDEAEEVSRLIDDRVPAPADRITAAIAVAKKAGKDALAYRLTAGRVKVELSEEYKSATPAELQQEIDGYSARISKAGDKAKPGDVIARDHLVSMRDSASSLLNADPLEFAARAWGLAVPPMDLTDPASIQQRMKVARTVAGRTGAPVSPLHDEEAAAIKAEMDKGPAGQLSVIDQLARGGSAFALAAARQVAPGDDGFRVATGLAVLPIPAVARAASRDAILGADVLKANPALFKDADAQKMFAGSAGRALRIATPQMQAGVMAAAKNIYAARLSRAGATKWDDDQWMAAVNAALGAYRDTSGVMRGGVGVWRGGPVMLPFGWSQGDLDTTIATANDATIARAGNGAPIWRNGAAVTAEQIKRLRLVGDGDGYYRLFDGSTALSVKGGGPFRLNVRKLRR